MSVRAKFKVTSKTQHEASVPNGNGGYKPGIMHTINMTPVYGNGDPEHENTKFWAASPNGKIEFGWVNEEAANQLEIGSEYYIDITKSK